MARMSPSFSPSQSFHFSACIFENSQACKSWILSRTSRYYLKRRRACGKQNSCLDPRTRSSFAALSSTTSLHQETFHKRSAFSSSTPGYGTSTSRLIRESPLRLWIDDMPCQVVMRNLSSDISRMPIWICGNLDQWRLRYWYPWF